MRTAGARPIAGKFGNLVSNGAHGAPYACWFGWAAAGPKAFPGSPDAAYLYDSAKHGVFWSEGLLVGLWLGSLGALYISREAFESANWKAVSLLRILIVFTPIIALATAKIIAP
jgi:hypothetical protein